MRRTPYGPFTRRVFAGLLAAAAAAPAHAALPRKIVVTMLGDSITAGYGLPAREALPTRLEQQVGRMIPGVRVRGAGVSGDTTAGGLARLDFSVQSDTTLCVVALGANDLLQGLDPKKTRANLDAILARLKARKVPALLVGLHVPTAIGKAYAREFAAVYTDLSKKYGVPLYPNLLDGVGGNRRLNQPDGLHPNAAGVNIIAGKLAPVIVTALRRRGA
jgi:acyl-CoA thioesterase-1